jgi:hypothetical protein
VPHVTLKHVDRAQKYVVLPSSVDQQPVAWALQNLRRLDSKQPASGDALKYEVAGESWQAMRLRPRKTAAATRVVLADIRYAWQADGRCLGAAFLDLETAAASDCPLELPEGFELLQLSVDGLPVDAVRRPPVDGARAGTWTVPLASQASVSRAEVLFFAESAIARAPAGWARRCSFRAPKLGDLPVERTVWTIASPRTLQGSIADGGPSPTLPAAAADAAASDIAAQWQRFVAAGQSTVICAGNGMADAIALDYRPVGAQSWLSRLAGLAAFLVAVALAALVIRRDLLGNWFIRWPHVCGVCLGLAWWLWLSPSAVGLLIVLAVLSWRFIPWPRFAVSSHPAPP